MAVGRLFASSAFAWWRNGRSCIAISIESTTDERGVILSQYLGNGINKINNGSFEIDYSKFEILPGLIDNDVLQSIQALPGIQSINETVSNINIRGGTHDQNLILWDGIKMYQSGHFFGLISAFSPYLTHEVKVSKNGTSAMYGDGVSSIIDMKSSSAISDITINSATSGGSVTDDGGADVIEKGVCWNTSANPTIHIYYNDIIFLFTF